MKIVNKHITVEFMGGESIYSCVSQAQAFAIKNYVTVKFKFNGVPMTVVPDCPASVMFGKNGRLLNSMASEWYRMVNSKVAEYHRKFDEAERKQPKKKEKTT